MEIIILAFAVNMDQWLYQKFIDEGLDNRYLCTTLITQIINKFGNKLDSLSPVKLFLIIYIIHCNIMTISILEPQREDIDVHYQQALNEVNDKIRLEMLKQEKQEAQMKLAAIYKSHFNKSVKTKSPTLVSKFTQNVEDQDNADKQMRKLSLNDDEIMRQKQQLLQGWMNSEPTDDIKLNDSSNDQLVPQTLAKETASNNISLESSLKPEEQKRSAAIYKSHLNQNVPATMVSHSAFEDKKTEEEQVLNDKLMDVGFNENATESHLQSNERDKELNKVQMCMIERVKKAGVDGLKLSELENFVKERFKDFDHKNYCFSSIRAQFGDFVSLCSEVVIVKDGSENGLIVVTRTNALKINLKSKLQIAMTLLFETG